MYAGGQGLAEVGRNLGSVYASGQQRSLNNSKKARSWLIWADLEVILSFDWQDLPIDVQIPRYLK